MEVLTMVWSSAPRNIPSSSPVRIVRTWACVYSPVSAGDVVARFVAIGNHSSCRARIRMVIPVSAATRGRFSWAVAAPLAGLVVLAASWGRHPEDPVAGVLAVFLIASVLAAVHHAEVVAHRVGEPLGTLVLAVAVTVIEAALILSMMFAGGQDAAVLPRDTIYAAVMIICNGVVGICVLVGGIAHREQTFRVEGAGGGLAALIVMAALTLVLPVFTTSTSSGTYNRAQLAFVAVSSGVLW